MAIQDTDTLARLALELGLVTDSQLSECRDEKGHLAPTPQELLRVLERKGFLTPWQSGKLLKGEREGFLLGGYRLLYRIASGSFGRVFRADDPRTGTVVAVKVLRRRWSTDTHSIDLFEREAKVGMSLRHPNIVSILSMSRDLASKQYYIVMEFVEGGTLRDFLAIRKKLEAGEALRLLEDATAGLAYAYSRGITHRDMKLTNIMISAQGTAKLVDFGLAGLSPTAAVEEDSQVDRSVDYAGLEKASGVKPGDVRSDIYFLGCVFYEMLTGRSPLVMTKDRNIRMQRQRFENAPPMGRDEVDAAPAVFELVETMMSLIPHRRYQNPAQLLDAIRAARREIDDKRVPAPAPEASGEPTVYLVEKNQKLQDVLKEKFQELGYKVVVTADPAPTLQRYRQKPFDALIVDVGSTGEDGLIQFERVLAEAQRTHRACAGIVVLSENQADWAEKVSAGAAIMVRPVTLRGLTSKLCELVPLPPKE